MLRRRLGRSAEPELVVVSARGDVPVEHPGHPSWCRGGHDNHRCPAPRERSPRRVHRPGLGDGPVLSLADVLGALFARGHRYVLTEGGPALLGHLVGEGLLDELFPTISPLLAGRDITPRPGLAEGVGLLPCCPEPAELLSARRLSSYLFLRYRLRPTTGQGPQEVTGSSSSVSEAPGWRHNCRPVTGAARSRASVRQASPLHCTRHRSRPWAPTSGRARILAACKRSVRRRSARPGPAPPCSAR